MKVLNVEEKPLTQEIIKEIEDRMKAYVDIDAVIYKSTVTTKQSD